MFPLLIKIKEVILDILFPPLCINCQKYLQTRMAGTNDFLCDDCYYLIKLNNTLFCPICRARLPENKKICHFDSPYLLAAAGNYDNQILQNLIHYFKYKSFENLAPILGKILIKYLENLFRNWKLEIRNFIIVPVPLHPQRERQRGFNQAKLIAEIIAFSLKLPLIDGLKRVKNTESQTDLKDYEARIKNVTNCFHIKNLEFIKDKNIILIDDVFTSGATINEAVRILRANGAKKIIALVIAKA